MDEEEREEMVAGWGSEVERPGAVTGPRRDRFPKGRLFPADVVAAAGVVVAAAVEASG